MMMCMCDLCRINPQYIPSGTPAAIDKGYEQIQTTQRELRENLKLLGIGVN